MPRRVAPQPAQNQAALAVLIGREARLGVDDVFGLFLRQQVGHRQGQPVPNLQQRQLAARPRQDGRQPVQLRRGDDLRIELSPRQARLEPRRGGIRQAAVQTQMELHLQQLAQLLGDDLIGVHHAGSPRPPAAGLAWRWRSRNASSAATTCSWPARNGA
jgi:hypothetical protein